MTHGAGGGTAGGLTLERREEEHGRVRLALVDHANGFAVDASALTIDVVELHVGDRSGDVVRVGGIGNVETRETHRRRGLAAHLLETAIDQMSAEGLDGSLLYGIDDYYDRFGWRSCGDERWVRVPLEHTAQLGEPSRDVHVRAMEPGDLAPLQAAYEQIARTVPGAARREPGGRAWASLAVEEVRVAIRGAELVGWAWRGRSGPAERTSVASREPSAAVFCELHALDAPAMHAVLVDACAWAREQRDEPGRTELLTGAPEGHPLRELVRTDRLTCRLEDVYRPTGGAMLLPFTDAGRALAERRDLYQFLADRF